MERVEKIIEFEIARINSHLPRRRESLLRLISMDDPRIQLRDGSYHYFKRDELMFLRSILDEEDAEKLKLPIVLEISTVDRGSFIVRGRVEVRVIKRVLGMEEGYEEGTVLRLPRYYLPRIRRKLPTTTVHAFIVEW
ncbi:hypothetical protein A3L04_10410 [Thermococcus chitonophagus]|uniref:UPF0216 protein A3L04_10410 n=1 Tax=Thermococcus chitonophagus TaxID=54262 RepID=A0A160VTL2_9EURY|nr:DUF61 family protein [Thermococcus chitonophagus]ASJ17452.1 hypothetical protein A3L04_10410 [Thermococcus chitonophagus]CUX78099.1 hypothetical protein CHITON_1320 [Thermococcus chitonophagus]